MRNRLLEITLSLCLILCGCSASGVDDLAQAEAEESIGYNVLDDIDSMSDPALTEYIEAAVWAGISNSLEEGYEIVGIEASYYPKEYVERVKANAKPNIYFGKTIDELEERFQGQPYVFDVDSSGETIVRAVEPYDGSLDEEYVKALENVAVGAGVIVVCVLVSAATGGTSTIVGASFAVGSEIAAEVGLGVSGVAGVVSGLVEGYETGDFEKGLKAGLLTGAETFKWSAISVCGFKGVSGLAKSLRAVPIACKNASLLGRTHPETGVKYIERLATNSEGKLCKGVFPQFDSVYETKLKAESLTKADAVQFKECTKNLQASLESNPSLAARFTETQLEQIRAGEAIDGLTWHHSEKTGIMQLVDSAIHQKTGHTGGKAVWGGGR